MTTAEMGRGVQSDVFIPAGTLLGTYPGQHLSLKSFLAKEEFISRSVRATFRLSEQVIIDPTDMFGFLPNSPALRLALINEPPPGDNFNVIAISTVRYVWYLTISDVKIGQQLFTHYGENYRRDYSSSSISDVPPNLSDLQFGCLKKFRGKHFWLKGH